MGREILADNGYSLSVDSFLFAILVDHIYDDKFLITFDDFEKKRIQFWNRGKICYYAFTKDELCNEIDNSYGPYIKSVGDFKWVVDMSEIFSRNNNYNNIVNDFTEKNLKLFFCYTDFYMKVFYLFWWLQIDERIFDGKDGGITHLLRCQWMFHECDSDILRHDEFLFKKAKSIKPDGNNVELLKLYNELRNIECQELRYINRDGERHRLSDEEVEQSIEEKIESLKVRVLNKEK